MGGDEKGYERGEAPMGGGVNGGLIHFQPCARTYRDMMNVIFGPERWEPYGNCAEQEFLSYFFAGKWNSIPAIWNYQVHQLFVSGTPEQPPGQVRVSRFYEQMDSTQGVKIWHYS